MQAIFNGGTLGACMCPYQCAVSEAKRTRPQSGSYMVLRMLHGLIVECGEFVALCQDDGLRLPVGAAPRRGPM